MDTETDKNDAPRYRKDFWKWIIIKEKIDNEPTAAFIQEGAIWLASIGVNVGFEMDGKGNDFARPVLIIKKINHETCIGIPITSKKKDGAYQVDIDLLGHTDQAVISHVRSLDRKRLLRHIGTASMHDFNAVIREFVAIFPKGETPSTATVLGESQLPFGANGITITDEKLNAS